MWILKWLILVIFFNQNPPSFLNDHLLERGINKSTFTLGIFDSIMINIIQVIPFCYLDKAFIIIVSIIYIIFLTYNFIKRKFTLYELILVLISLVPILRYLVLFNHSYDHFFFTYRALLPSIIVSLLLFCQKFKKNDNRKNCIKWYNKIRNK